MTALAGCQNTLLRQLWSQPSSGSHPLVWAGRRLGQSHDPRLSASRLAQTPQTPSRDAKGVTGDRYNGDAFPNVSSLSEPAPPPLPARIFVEHAVWDAVFENHYAPI